MKLRLEHNIYSYETAFERLKSAIREENNNEVYASVGELLLWILTTEEFHFEHNIQYNTNKNYNRNALIIYGLRHAYNMVKHNMEFLSLFKKEIYGGFNSGMFNTQRFSSGTIEYRWIIIEDVYLPEQK